MEGPNSSLPVYRHVARAVGETGAPQDSGPHGYVSKPDFGRRRFDEIDQLGILVGWPSEYESAEGMVSVQSIVAPVLPETDGPTGVVPLNEAASVTGSPSITSPVTVSVAVMISATASPGSTGRDKPPAADGQA